MRHPSVLATLDPPERGWRSGELARRAGVSTDTLRHYERKGVLPAPQRLANGYRRYPPEALSRVGMVRAALALGFTLDELATLLRARDRGRPPCQEVRTLAARKLAAAEVQLAELARLVETLRAVLAGWDRRLAATHGDQPARLLEELATGLPAPAGRASTRRPQPRPRRTR